MRKKMCLLLNILIIVFEIIGFVLSFRNYSRIPIEYYTEDSNILTLITSIIFIAFVIAGKKTPYFLKILKYISAVCLTVTFLVVVCILIPLYNFDFNSMLFKGEMIFHHILCPIVGVITFLFFDEIDKYTTKESLVAVSATFIYGVIIIILNVLNKISGPYPFLEIRNQTVTISIMWSVIMFLLTYIVAFLFRRVKKS